MKWASHPRTRFLLASISIVAVIGSLVVRLSKTPRTKEVKVTTIVSASPALPPPVIITSPSPLPSPSIFESPTPVATQSQVPSPSLQPSVGASNLIIPVAGVRPEQLIDTFTEARSEGRVHDAIDIPAPHGTPVIAAADGTIVKLFQSDRGGTTVYELSSDQKYFYYYAHLDRYAEGLSEGQVVRQGATIAYVGDTGNAGPGNYHLHFSISIVGDPKRWWEGTNINPFPLLRH
jgi:peptidoglycan LD-endopeptidase LytH